MSSVSVRLLPEQLRSIAFGSISGTYAGIGTSLANPSRIIKFTNDTDVTIILSIDGVNDYEVLPAYTNMIIDLTANHTSVGGAATVAQGTRWYVKGSPSVGSVYLSTWYGSNF